jgi:broad specificity phosphatase PhoE
MNAKMLMQGRSNHPLNEMGFAQADEAAERFAEMGVKIDKVYTSPLIRAVQTAERIAPDAEIVVDERLIEMDYGPYEGCSLLDPPQEIIEFFSDFVNNPAPEGMENLSDLVARMGRFMESLKKEGDQTILISTHAIAMKGILEHLTPESHGAYWNKHIANCAVYRTTFSDGAFTVPVELINE